MGSDTTPGAGRGGAWLPSKRQLGASYLTGLGAILFAFAVGQFLRGQVSGVESLVAVTTGLVLAGTLLPLGPWLVRSPLADEHVLTVSEAGAIGLALPTGVVVIAGLFVRPAATLPGPGYLLTLMATGTVVGALFGALLALQREHGRRLDLFHRNRQLTRVLQHAVRDGMTVVSGYADLLEDELEGSSEDMVAAIGQQARAIADIGDAAGSLDALEDPDAVEAVALDEVVETLVDGMGEFHPAATVSVESDGSPTVSTDPTVVELALWHLLDRALENGDRDVTVRVRDAGAGASIAVEGAGPPLPVDAIDAVTGGEDDVLDHPDAVDVWLARWLVEDVGGTMSVDAGEGEGLTATIDLPATAPPRTGRAR